MHKFAKCCLLTINQVVTGYTDVYHVDETEICTRIKKANIQFGALQKIFNNQKVRLGTKFLLYKSIILNTVLWGCESWSLTADAKRKLESFQNNIIRRILRIDMYMVQNEKITNVQIKTMFYNTPSINKIIKARQLKWLGKIAKMENDRMPRKLLASWIKNPRKPGRPQLNIRNSFAKALSEFFPKMRNAELKHWIPTLASKEWKNTLQEWVEDRDTCDTVPD